MACTLCGKNFIARMFSDCAEQRCPHKTEADVADAVDAITLPGAAPDIKLPPFELPDIDLGDIGIDID